MYVDRRGKAFPREGLLPTPPPSPGTGWAHTRAFHKRNATHNQRWLKPIHTPSPTTPTAAGATTDATATTKAAATTATTAANVPEHKQYVQQPSGAVEEP